MFLDESGFMLQPLRRRTWAPRGQTPIHYAWDRHDRWSVIGALSLAPWALRIGVYFRLYDHNIVADDVVEFVKQMHRQLGRKVSLGLGSAGTSTVPPPSGWRDIAGCKIEWLPSYAPELNPVESMWSYTKYNDLANYIPEDAQHLHHAIHSSMTDHCHDPYLKHAFFRHAKLIA